MATPVRRTLNDVVVNLLGDFSLSIYFLPIRSFQHRVRVLTRYYGLATSLVLNVLVRNLWCVEAEILAAKDDALATLFREAHQSECNMTAVTSALVASISTAALMLPDLSHTKWPAEALFVASLVLSLIAVFIASKQQKTTGRLLQPRSLRRYICVRKDVVTGKTCPEREGIGQPWSDYITTEWAQSDYVDTGDSLCVYLPSPVSCVMLASPRLLLSASVLCFIFGIGVFLGCLALNDLEQDRGGRDRNIFIVYCVTAGFAFSLYMQSSLVQWSQKASDQGDKIMEDLSKRRRNIIEALQTATVTEYRDYVAKAANYPSMPQPKLPTSVQEGNEAAGNEPVQHSTT